MSKPTIGNSTGNSAGGSTVNNAGRSAGQLARERGYRELALKMYPWICARCGREFSGKRVSELTVHHKDHNHDNNPADGSNWELLCLYCHDNEHSKFVDQVRYGSDAPAKGDTRAPARHNALASLGALVGRDTPKDGE